MIEKIKYGSPGNQDFAGFGKALEVVADLLKYLLERKQRQEKHLSEMRITAEAHDTEMRRRREELRKLQIENARAMVDFMKQGNVPAKKINQAVRRHMDQYLILDKLVDEGKITQVNFDNPHGKSKR